MLKNLEDIILLARNRKESPVSGSYTNQLLNDKSLSKAKVLEEVNELIQREYKDREGFIYQSSGRWQCLGAPFAQNEHWFQGMVFLQEEVD